MSDRFGTTALLHKEIANMANEERRHCRIGKVTVKPKPMSPYRLALLECWKWTPPKNEWWQNPRYPTFATPNTSGCNDAQ